MVLTSAFQENKASVSEIIFHAGLGVTFIDASQSHLDFVWDTGPFQSHFILEWFYVTNDFEIYNFKLIFYYSDNFIYVNIYYI